MEKNRKLIDLTGAPFIVELREDGKWYIVGVKVRRREFIFESTGLPVDVVEKIEGVSGDGKINGLAEVEEFLQGQQEGSNLNDKIPDEYATDEDMTNAWQEALARAKENAGIDKE
jgi:hypothetical protein